MFLPKVVYVEVAGTCNLSCPSCPVGNIGQAGRPKNLIDIKLYEQIVEKLKREYSEAKTPLTLGFYDWGEPTLHPDLPKMIRMANNAGFNTHVSSNLNVDFDLKAFVKAEPNLVIVSFSGINQEVYELTHRGGDVNILISNLHKLRYYIDKLNKAVTVQGTFHLYRTNLLSDLTAAQSLFNSLGFEFNPVAAALLPLEKLLRFTLEEEADNIPALANVHLQDKDNEVIGRLITHPSVVMNHLHNAKRSRTHALLDDPLKGMCPRQWKLPIRTDGSVDLCCYSYVNELNLGKNFLDTPMKVLSTERRTHKFCETCVETGASYYAMANDYFANEKLEAFGSQAK